MANPARVLLASFALCLCGCAIGGVGAQDEDKADREAGIQLRLNPVGLEPYRGVVTYRRGGASSLSLNLIFDTTIESAGQVGAGEGFHLTQQLTTVDLTEGTVQVESPGSGRLRISTSDRRVGQGEPDQTGLRVTRPVIGDVLAQSLGVAPFARYGSFELPKHDIQVGSAWSSVCALEDGTEIKMRHELLRTKSVGDRVVGTVQTTAERGYTSAEGRSMRDQVTGEAEVDLQDALHFSSNLTIAVEEERGSGWVRVLYETIEVSHVPRSMLAGE